VAALPALNTLRLTLQPVTIDDVDTLHRLWTDPDVRRYLWDDQVISRERAEEYVRGTIEAGARDGRGMWLIHEEQAAAPIGFCGFSPRDEPAVGELIYGLAPGAWGCGYATECAGALLDYGFTTLGLTKIVASTDVPNTASARVLERIGMRFQRREIVNGLDLVFYEIATADRQGAT
jgi:[ribosomal protein S5]-alanine N-acetyltransferase